MNKMGTIIGFTFKNKVRTKSFMITTLILVLLLSIGMNLPYIIDQFKGDSAKSEVTQIAVIAEEGNQVAELLKAYTAPEGMPQAKIVQYASAEDAELKKALDEETVEGYVTFAEPTGEGLPPVTYHSNDGELNGDVQVYLQNALQQANTQFIVGDKLTSEQIAAMSTPVQITTQQLNAGGGSESSQEDTPAINYIIVYAMLMLFFMSIMMTGNMIAAEITSEKSSRIMEILITSASPLAQMFGKVIGVFLVGILQIGIFVAAIVVNLTLPHNATVLADFDLDLGQLNINLLLYGFVLYVLGYFLYALMYAAVGSIVSRTEDLGQAVMPIMMLGFVAFYVPLFSISNADTLVVKIASYVPFTSPLTMLLRIGVGEVAIWQVIVSLLILLVTTFIFGWLAAKIYRTGVLMYGKRPSIKEIRKAMKAYKI
ncbi:ABC transporter permease [Paenibacillus sp. FSL R7-0048]|jgi:ABC-2 type transport system permease protein|uniref:ABC transporter permease n=1 Tax=Paenibacillus odorifer TaxID=189426 RepID=A0ABX3GRL9_9BACL|nr:MULTISPECIES: ABC transporter permease [Paenibacillus]MDH6429230.1 ABC-2 type transport system permease protein [Paenibacillus sp. PastH-4]MDH6445437.1 ABC-2 type transport system permease protein [Paenibacillus sp. PastF-4]MDH6529325.1 ABC-2 type transport system permease protein [Paenibacillus sp. PastH-3]OMC63911.1 ABC transporter permease [Paenibacillus odorifer]OMC70508.1 ABC transporter permease [Paenibacillus odorifer]